MRGTPWLYPSRMSIGGIIPAYAGNTFTLMTGSRSRRDHPRICGEHGSAYRDFINFKGSSPHMRGTLFWTGNLRITRGIIPAYAGNTCTIPAVYYANRDHPRICGEHPFLLIVTYPALGSSPHMRGTQPAAIQALLRGGGSSPHMRGTRVKMERREFGTRIIPAYAGNTVSASKGRIMREDHPRICGEHYEADHTEGPWAGSSPHMRGTHKKRQR